MTTVTSVTNTETSTPISHAPSGAASAFKAAVALASLLNQCLLVTATFLNSNVDSEKEALKGPQQSQNDALLSLQNKGKLVKNGQILWFFENEPSEDQKKEMMAIAQAKLTQATEDVQLAQKKYQALFDLQNEGKNIASSSIQQMLQMMATLAQSMQALSSLVR